jgi:hypothetical protein
MQRMADSVLFNQLTQLNKEAAPLSKQIAAAYEKYQATVDPGKQDVLKAEVSSVATCKCCSNISHCHVWDVTVLQPRSLQHFNSCLTRGRLWMPYARLWWES